MSFKLFCLILPDPDPAQHVFPVNIDKNQTVGDLKDLIKAKKSNALRNIDAAELIVWKLEPAIAAEGLQTALEALTFDGDARELEAMDEMEEVLNEAPAKKHLHIVAHLPTPQKRPRSESDADSDYAKRCKLATIAPSAIATSAYYQRLPSSEKILNDRPNPNKGVAPIALLYHGFGLFEDIFRGSAKVPRVGQVDTGALRTAVDLFAITSQSIFESEKHRQIAVLPLLNKILRAHSEILDGLSTTVMLNAITDGHVNHVNGPHGAIVTIAEFKNAITNITAIPEVQLASYVAHSFVEAIRGHSELFKAWRVPSLGISIIGDLVQFHAIIFLGQYRTVALTPLLSCTQPAGDIHSRQMLYAAFTAACVLHSQISIDAAKFLVQLPPKISGGERLLPDVRSIAKFPASPAARLKFEIIRLHDDCWNRFLYHAKTETPTEVEILVKFTRRYSVTLHQLCELAGHAPKLLGFEELPGGWLAVAMDYVSARHMVAKDDGPKLSQWKTDMENLMASFHKKGLVHGDLRDANLIVPLDDTKKLMVIDFDWGGKAGEVSYPTDRLNEDLLEGRPGTDLTITKEDDERVLKTTFNKLMIAPQAQL